MFKIVNDFKNANTPMTVRFTEKMFDELKRISKENKISFNLLILQCCQYAIDNMEKDA